MRHAITLIITLITLCCGPRAAAQLLNGATADAPTAPVISLLTFAPGAEIYSLEGHSGLRIVDADGDMTANWGLFDFNSPNFVYRFVKGETDYEMGVFPTEPVIEMYRQEGRRVTEQVLNLTPEQARRVKAMVIANLASGERVYRYNYVKDNCATRPLRIVESAIGDSITLASALEELRPRLTFRRAMTHYHANYPWYQFGIDLALGSGIDYVLANDELAFAPVALETMAAGAVIHRPEGDVPLVSLTRTLVDLPADAAVSSATPWYLTPLAVFTALMLVAFALTLRDLRRRRPTAWFDGVFYTLLGLTGLVLTFLIFVSVHEATSPNYLYLWINPLCLVLGLTAAMRRRHTLLRWLWIVNALCIAAYAGVLIAGLQDFNPAFIPLLLTDLSRTLLRLFTAYNPSAAK